MTQDPIQPLDGGAEAEDPQDTGAFAAYDKTLERFVGGVHRGDKAKTTARNSPQAKAAKDAGHTVEVRQV